MTTIAQLSNQYAPIKAVLDAALAGGGGRYDAPTPGAAVHFRHRAYTFRKAYREACAPGPSPYDRLTIRKLKRGDTSVVIEPMSLPGTFTPTGTGPVEVDEPEDELLAEARRIARELDL